MLTKKQEDFAQAYVTQPAEKGAGSAAYRIAYKAGGMGANAIAREASLLLKNPKVAQRIAELRKPAAEAAQVTLEQHLDDLKRLRDRAEDEGKFSAAVSAEVARGKAAGLYVEKHELTGKDGKPLIVAATMLSDDQLADIASRSGG